MPRPMQKEPRNRGTIGSRPLDWVFIGFCFLVLSYFWRPWNYLTPAAVLILAINFIIVALLLRWADGFEREPLQTVIWGITWGAFPAIFIALLLSKATTPLLIAAMVEEFAKLIGVYLVFRRGSIHSATDALVMGGYVGLGFTIFEDFAYSVGNNQPLNILIFRGIFSVFAHALFSGIGAALMYLLWRRMEFSGVVLGFICSYLIHFLWNFSLSIDLMSISFLLSVIIYSIAPPVALFLTCQFVRRREVADLRSKGSAAVESGLIAYEDLEEILRPSHRRKKLKTLQTRADKRNYRKNIQASARRILEIDRDDTSETYSDFGFNSTQQADDPWA